MSLLQALREAKVLRTLDDALANTLRRLDPSIPDDVLAAAALASRTCAISAPLDGSTMGSAEPAPSTSSPLIRSLVCKRGFIRRPPDPRP